MLVKHILLWFAVCLLIAWNRRSAHSRCDVGVPESALDHWFGIPFDLAGETTRLNGNPRR
jgi:hypothetical protein